MLAHHARLVLDTLGRTRRADFALGSRIPITIRAVETSTASTDAFSLSVADLTIGREARVCGYRAFTGSSGPAWRADAFSTVALSVFGTDFAIVTGTVEVVALAELTGDLFLGVGTWVALATTTVTHSTTLADGGFVGSETRTSYISSKAVSFLPLTLLIECCSAHSRPVTLAVLSDVPSFAPTYSAHHISSVTLFRICDDFILAFTITVAEHFHVYNQRFVESRRSDAENEVSLVDTVRVLEGYFELNFVSNTDSLTDVRVLQGGSTQKFEYIIIIEKATHSRHIDL